MEASAAIVPNYSKPPEQVSVNLVRLWINKHRNLNTEPSLGECREGLQSFMRRYQAGRLVYC